MQEETDRLKEMLQKEEMGRLQREQVIEELRNKIKALGTQQRELEVSLREKQESEIESDHKVKQLRQKAHKLSEKVSFCLYDFDIDDGILLVLFCAAEVSCSR